MRDVVGYEEKEPRVLGALQSGYPRFFENPLVTKLKCHLSDLLELVGRELLLFSSEASARRGLEVAGGGRLERCLEGAVFGLSFADSQMEAFDRAKIYMKRAGVGLSSRVAEEQLLILGSIPFIYPESRFNGDAENHVSDELCRVLGVSKQCLRICSSGMNAFYAAFEAVNALARPLGRRRWVRLGWLYVDTMDVIDEMCDPDFPSIAWGNLGDLKGLRERLMPISGEIAGIIVETPTNPLFETVDLPALSALAKEVGARLVVDPSLVSPWNAPGWAGADVLVSSLTKYAAGAGDVLGGVVVVNSIADDADSLRNEIEAWVTPMAVPDCARLALEIGEAEDLVSSANRTLAVVVEYLRAHSRVDQVWSPVLPKTDAYSGSGAVCSFTVKGSMPAFYDALEMAKGPSFGTSFTLISPYMWLAHYDLINSRGVAEKADLDGAASHLDLLRLSVGNEEAAATIEVIERAFASMPA